MLLCIGTTDKIQVITSAAGKIDTHASYADYNGTAVSLGRENNSITTAATTDVVDAPGSGVTRNVKTLNVSNAHASVTNTVTIQHTDGTTVAEIEKVTLLPGERIAIREGVPTRVIDANGLEKTNPNAAVTYKRLASDYTNSTVTASKVTNLDFPVPAGTYVFEYYLLYQSAATTTAIKLSVNHSGTVSKIAYWARNLTGLATAADGIGDQDVLTTTGGVMQGWAARAKSAAATMVGVGVDTANADMLMVVEGIVIVTADGNLELYGASEVAASLITILAGSSLRLTRTG